MTDTERWLHVPGYEGLYQVSDRGRVARVDRWVRCIDGRLRHHQGKFLTLSAHPAGYTYVRLHRDGKARHHLVHRLVLAAFVGPCPPGMEALHGEGGPADNRWPENLRWGTHVENEADKERAGTRPRGSACSWSKLTEQTVTLCRRAYAEGTTIGALARQYDMHWGAMQAVVLGRTWRHVDV